MTDALTIATQIASKARFQTAAADFYRGWNQETSGRPLHRAAVATTCQMCFSMLGNVQPHLTATGAWHLGAAIADRMEREVKEFGVLLPQTFGAYHSLRRELRRMGVPADGNRA